tara:strand:+ start:1220 stop:1645 length:426 start_codon:yes stop_codon:yes gene_type:complete
MKSRLEKVYSKLPNQKVNLKAHKVALGLIDNLDYDYNTIEDQGGLLSYLAYEWHEEKFEAYRQAWMALNDEYQHNASVVFRYDDVSGDVEKLNEIKAKAEELGLEPSDVYSDWNEHMQRLKEMKEADDQYKENEREFRDWS